MKIVHCCLSNFYIDGFSYQENELVAQHVADGHEVTVIASTETFSADQRIAYCEPGEYLGTDGARVIRIPYRRFLPAAIMRKLRMHPGVLERLDSLKPDVILFHGTCGWELYTLARYKDQNPNTRLFVDSHEDFDNSARTWTSKWILHYLYYRVILRKCLPRIEQVLCVNMAAISFVRDFYGIPANKIAFYPLGGRLLTDRMYAETRAAARIGLDVEAEDIVFLQSGKIDRRKKLLESVRAFMKLECQDARFIIAGHLQDDIAEEVGALLRSDERIVFLGWKTPDELRALLCAADVYVQPGTQSATMQMSLCCRCAVILDDVPSHRPFMDNNGWLVGEGLSLEDAFRLAAEGRGRLTAMAEKSADIASGLLDYRILAARLYG
jgi:glycosyltransferase involved in cell wall biosynthesis